MLNDLRYALRTLRKTPGFTVVAIVTLALGIGANTAMFSVVKAVLLAKLPYPHPEQLVQLWETSKTSNHVSVSGPNFRDWHNQAHSFQALAYTTNDVISITGEFAPQRVQVRAVSREFFQVVGVNAFLGHTLLPEEPSQAVSPFAVISYPLWQTAFQANLQAIGKIIHAYGSTFTVVGVMPPGFDFPQKAQLWLPREFFADPSTRSAQNYRVYGRLEPSFSLASAQADMDVVAKRLSQEYVDDKDRGIRVVSLQDEIVGPVRPSLLILFAAVGFVLLIAVANIANLQLARSVSRIKEMALRSALGAGRRRLIRQLLTECLLLSGMGGLAGLVLAFWGTDFLRVSIPPNIPRVEDIRVEGWTLLFTLAVSGSVGILFGLIPAWGASRVSTNESLKEGSGKSTAGPARRRLENALVAGEIGIAMVLLVGASLLLQSFWNLEHVPVGFQPAGVITAEVPWPVLKNEDANATQLASNTRQLLERVRALPGVTAAGVTSSLPLSGRGANGSFEMEGTPLPEDPHDAPDAWYRVITSGYLEALGIPLVQGRTLDGDRDLGNGPQVAVVNQAFAKRFYPGVSILGKRIRFLGFDRKPQFMEIIGVVSDFRSVNLRVSSGPEVFVNGMQHPDSLANTTLVVRGPVAVVSSIRSILNEISPEIPVTFTPMDDVISQSLERQRFQTTLLAIFAGLALLLAAVGIYGVLSYSVDRRTAEFGIRIALGGDQIRVLGMVMREAAVLIVTGIAIGTLGAAFTTQTLKSFLYGVNPTHPAAFTVTGMVLSAVGLVACYLPARRATKVDPLTALRYE